MTDSVSDITAPLASESTGPQFGTDKAELEDWISETPSEATVKGMYVETLLSMLKRRGAARRCPLTSATSRSRTIHFVS